MNLDLYSLQSLYSLSGILITILYVPQLMSALKAKTPLKEISLLTWSLWTICLAVSFFYALLEAKDLKFALVSLGGCVFCCLISTVTLFKRRKYKETPKKSKRYLELTMN